MKRKTSFAPIEGLISNYIFESDIYLDTINTEQTTVCQRKRMFRLLLTLCLSQE